jgi:hypothetical protein
MTRRQRGLAGAAIARTGRPIEGVLLVWLLHAPKADRPRSSRESEGSTTT